MQGTAVEHEDRFVDIEIKLAQQEDLVDSLNTTVYQQARRIDQLEAMVQKLGELDFDIDKTVVVFHGGSLH